MHDPAKVLLDLAIGLAVGGDCLADVAVLRAEPRVFGLVASDPTVSRTIDRLAGDVTAALAATDTARAAARAPCCAAPTPDRAWSGRTGPYSRARRAAAPERCGAIAWSPRT